MNTPCSHQWDIQPYCGCHVCHLCNQHAHVTKGGDVTQTLARCYCGWASSGGDGRKELLEMGETIDPDPDDGWG